MSQPGSYPSYRTPQGDGEKFRSPPLEALPGTVASNHALPRDGKFKWHGPSLIAIISSAREQFLADAVRYTRQYLDVDLKAQASDPLIVTGHQPELFHPGVWLKNFEAASLASKCQGTAVNLIIDSDLCRSPAIRVPMGTASDLRVETVAFDQSQSEIPFEERSIIDAETWQSFGLRVSESLALLVAEPLVADWWPTVQSAAKENKNLGRTLSQSRHRLEQQWGFQSLELPQSWVCRSEGFRLFVLELTVRAAEFREVYNAALTDYRQAHGIKNHAHPMPLLARTDSWVEVPFWIWSSADPRRRGVFVKKIGNELEFTDRDHFTERVPRDAALAVERLAAWESRGIKLRTRALATTLFARLFLADLFIHGIGGAKYDQVTDDICRRFFGGALPAYATISGTLRLPIAKPARPVVSSRNLRQELREHRFHPERSRSVMQIGAGEVSRVEQLVAEKKSWVHTPKTVENAAERHQAINEINRQLQSLLDTRREQIARELAIAKRAEGNERLRRSREYSFALFPAAMLRQFFTP